MCPDLWVELGTNRFLVTVKIGPFRSSLVFPHTLTPGYVTMVLYNHKTVSSYLQP